MHLCRESTGKDSYILIWAILGRMERESLDKAQNRNNSYEYDRKALTDSKIFSILTSFLAVTSDREMPLDSYVGSKTRVFLLGKERRSNMKKITRRNFIRALGLTATTAATAYLMAGCGKQEQSGTEGSQNTNAKPGVVNIGSTSSLTSLNPLLVDGSWMNIYACSLQFRPLAAMQDNEGFVGALADSIRTEDNLTYTIHIDDRATWSDGVPVTADDLVYTMWALSSAKVGNLTLTLTNIEGVDPKLGYRAEGVDSLEGVQKVDDKTVTFKLRTPMSYNVFMTGFAQYILPVPSHKLSQIPEDQLSTSTWFNAPDVVSGPYICTGKDNDHYVTYKANEAYWLGAPQIPLLNIKVVDSAQLLSGLKSGEIDVVPPLLGTISQEDYDTILSLPDVVASYGQRYAVEALFINCERIPNKKIRQALLCSLDRTSLIDGLLNGEADQYDGFAVPAGPYNRGMEATAFDPARAATLVEEAKAEGWDSSTVYDLYLNSGDSLLVQACTVAQQFWSAAGLNVNLNTVDLSTLLGLCVEGKTDLCGVQYTYPPTDPSWDILWLLPSWCRYESDVVTQETDAMWNAENDTAYADALEKIDADMKENVPFINLYINGPLGAVAKRVQGAEALMYGCLNNVESWKLAD